MWRHPRLVDRPAVMRCPRCRRHGTRGAGLLKFRINHAGSDASAQALMQPEELRAAENRRRSFANLRPWRPGQSGNPLGARGSETI
jgi:hypothetical protein